MKQYVTVHTLIMPVSEKKQSIILGMVGPRGGYDAVEFGVEEAKLLLEQLSISIKLLGGKPETAIVEVSGGVAELTQCPPHITVEIIDHDNLAADAEIRASLT